MGARLCVYFSDYAMDFVKHGKFNNRSKFIERYFLKGLEAEKDKGYLRQLEALVKELKEREGKRGKKEI